MKKYIFSREKLIMTPEGMLTRVFEREWPKWCDGKEATFYPLARRGTVVFEGVEFDVYREWCEEVTE